MRLLLGLLLSFIVAAGVGLGSTFLALSRGLTFDSYTVGAWTAWPKTGTTDIDPYARASIARSGELPVGAGDGVAFYARTDEAGRPLDGRCDVTVSGITPQARFWTLTLYNIEGQLVGNSLHRQGFTSQEIVRATDGAFEIVVAPRARAGNWLPSGGIDHYLLVLRLYDSPVSLASRTGQQTPMPSVKVRSCPS